MHSHLPACCYYGPYVYHCPCHRYRCQLNPDGFGPHVYHRCQLIDSDDMRFNMADGEKSVLQRDYL